MKKIVEFLEKNPVQYLATVGRDGKAKCRPFMFCLMAEDKLWFCTNSTKDVYKDMQENPEIEISVASPEYAWIRLGGKAVFENNMAIKSTPGFAWAARPSLKTTWPSRRLASRTPSSRDSINVPTIPSLRCSTWKTPPVSSPTFPAIHPTPFKANKKHIPSELGGCVFLVGLECMVLLAQIRFLNGGAG